MKKIKEIYSQPQCETLVVRFEGNIMSPAYGAKGAAGATMSTNNYGEQDEDLF